MSKPGVSRRDLLKASAATVALSALSTAALAATMSPRSRDLYEAAKKEGEITWYTAHSDDTTAQALGHGFEETWPGIRTSVVRTTAQVAFQLHWDTRADTWLRSRTPRHATTWSCARFAVAIPGLCLGCRQSGTRARRIARGRSGTRAAYCGSLA